MYLGIDLGTSGVKSLLVDTDQKVIAEASAELSIQRPHDGWSEQAPADWLAAVEQTFTALKHQSPVHWSAIRGIGLSGQMHGATLLDRAGEVLRPCILWNDTRAADQADELDTALSRELTGNILFPGFTAPKLAWVAQHEPSIFEKIHKVLLPKDYIRFWLTGEMVAEMSDASGTGWLDVAARSWSTELLEQTGLDENHMPALVEGTAVSGVLRPAIADTFGFAKNVVVAGGGGDNAASACGLGVVESGSAFLSLGTSGVLFAANDQFKPNAASAVHAFCHAVPSTWHQMGVILAATDALNWLARTTRSSAETLAKQAAGQSPDTPCPVLFLPYLGGERTPWNDASARGVFTGLTHSTDQAVLTHAVMQGVAYAFRDCQSALAEAGTELDSAWVTGGGSRSEFWLQLLANTLNLPLKVPAAGEQGAALGAARLALVAAESASVNEVCLPPALSRVIEPRGNNAAFAEQHERYRNTYQALRSLDQSD